MAWLPSHGAGGRHHPNAAPPPRAWVPGVLLSKRSEPDSTGAPRARSHLLPPGAQPSLAGQSRGRPRARCDASHGKRPPVQAPAPGRADTPPGALARHLQASKGEASAPGLPPLPSPAPGFRRRQLRSKAKGRREAPAIPQPPRSVPTPCWETHAAFAHQLPRYGASASHSSPGRPPTGQLPQEGMAGTEHPATWGTPTAAAPPATLAPWALAHCENWGA